MIEFEVGAQCPWCDKTNSVTAAYMDALTPVVLEHDCTGCDEPFWYAGEDFSPCMADTAKTKKGLL